MKNIVILLFLVPIFLFGGDTNLQFNGYEIKAYKPNYFIFSYDNKDPKENKKTNRGEVKFRISIRRDFANDFFGLNETCTFAYSQLAFWGVMENSMPFYETNYEPELFVTIPINELSENLDYLRFSLNHQSNGLGGDDSRSWNRFYVMAKFNFGNFSVMPRIWKAFAISDLNEDIEEYAGRGDIEFRYKFGKREIRLEARNNFRFKENRGAIEITYLSEIASGLNWYVQYFDGYAESLIGYNRYTQKAGIGFSLIK